MSDTPPVVPYDDTRTRKITALTASAVRRQITTAGKVPDEARVQRKDWQTEAWGYFRSVGEVAFAMLFLGDAVSKLRLFVAARPDPEAPPVPVDDPESGVDPTAAKIAMEALERLKGDQGGQAQILREMEVNLEVAGELTLYGRPAAEEKTDPVSGKVLEQARPEETWEVLSVSELHTDAGGTSVILSDVGDRRGRPVAKDDITIRMWTRDPEFSGRAFCHLRPLLDECETLQILSRDLRATGRSRLAGNGILLVPSELSFGSTDPSAPANADPFFDDLMTTMMAPIQDEGNAAAVVPLVVRGPADVLEKVRHLTLARPNDAATDEKIERRLIRIANGLNLPLEIVLSHRSTTFCGDDQTEVLTISGWRRHDQVEPGTVVLTLDHETGLAEWQAVEAVHRFDVVDEPLLMLNSKRHSSATTMNHRWPVVGRNGSRQWRTSERLRDGDQLVLSAPLADYPTEPKWNDDLVELVAWAWTEGTKAGRLVISQSERANPEKVLRIRALLTRLFGPEKDSISKGRNTAQWRSRRNENSGVINFHLSGPAAAQTREIAPAGVVDRGFLRSLTRAQLELFIATSVDADGSWRGDGRWFYLNQANHARAESFEYACMLSGRSVRTTIIRPATGFSSRPQWMVRGNVRQSFHVGPLLDGTPGRVGRSAADHGTPGVPYTGVVWCPQTANGTWMARRNGYAYFTGNSNAFQIDRNTFDDHVQPRGAAVVDLLTNGYLRPTITTPVNEGGPPQVDVAEAEKMFVWFDATELLARPNQAEEADKAHEDGVISDEARRRYLGIPETDAPDDDDLLRALLRRASLDPTMTAEILGRLGVTGISVPERPQGAGGPPLSGETETLVDGDVIDVDAQPVEPLEPEALDRAAELGITAAATNTGERVGRRLMQIDRTLRTRLEVAADRAMTRALERAGAKLRAKVGRSGDLAVTVDGIPNAHVAATLGQLVVSGLGFASDDLLNGAFDDLADDCDEWIGGAQANAAGLIGRFSGASPTSLDALAQRQQQGRERAREVLIGGLMLLAGKRLFDPSPAAPPLGETDSSLSVPTGVLRDVLSVAGGQTPDTEDGPLWGVATGPDVMGVLSESGGGVEGYEWDYGPADRRPFPPHEALDGTVVENVDDPAWVNEEGWPDSQCFPGDHDGCFPVGTVVSGVGAAAASARWYEGPLIELSFASGEFLTCTPNHPILTSQGFVAAEFLTEGDDVIGCADPNRVAVLVDPDHHQRPAPIEEIFGALDVGDPTARRHVPTSAVDFHGDGEGSKVHVVRTDLLLRDRLQAALGQPEGQLTLIRRLRAAAGLTGLGSGDPAVEGVWLAALGLMGTHDQQPALLGAHGAVAQQVSGADIAGFDASFEEPFTDGAPIDAVAGSEFLLRDGAVFLGQCSRVGQAVHSSSLSGQGAGLLDRAPDASLLEFAAQHDWRDVEALGGPVAAFAGEVRIDRVTKTVRRRGATHVYNLDTGVGWFMAGTVVVGNCVCDITPILITPGESAGE